MNPKNILYAMIPVLLALIVYPFIKQYIPGQS